MAVQSKTRLGLTSPKWAPVMDAHVTANDLARAVPSMSPRASDVSPP